MTERHPLLQDPHRQTLVGWHPVEGTSATDEVAIGCSVGAAIAARNSTGAGPEED